MKKSAHEKANQAKAQPDEKAANREESPNELRLPVWSVISFEKSEARGLTYSEAEQKLSELEAQKVSGLCIVTDEVAARISNI